MSVRNVKQIQWNGLYTVSLMPVFPKMWFMNPLGICEKYQSLLKEMCKVKVMYLVLTKYHTMKTHSLH